MAQAGKLDQKAQESISTLYRQGESYVDIAKLFGVSTKSIEYQVKRLGIYDKDRGKVPEEVKAMIIDMYAKNVPLAQIAEKVGVADRTISERLKRWNVPLKSTERTKIINRNNVTELDVVAKYRELESVNDTAAHFNTSDVTIAKILKRHKVKGVRTLIREFLEENKDFILERYRDGCGLITIAQEMGISYSTLYLNMHRWGVEIFYPGVKEIRQRLETDKDKIKDLYYNKNVSLSEIAEMYDISDGRMGRAAKEWGWEIRRFGIETWIEKHVETLLKDKAIEHKKQFPIENRIYDFFVPSVNLLIETHGNYWHGNPTMYTELDHIQLGGQKRDEIKLRLAKAYGHDIIYFWEKDISDRPEWVANELYNAITTRLTTHPSLHKLV